MKDIYVIIIAFVALLTGVLVDYLIRKSKIDYLDKEKENSLRKIDELQKQYEQVNLLLNSCKTDVAVKEEKIKDLTSNVEKLQIVNTDLMNEKNKLSVQLADIRASKSAIEESNKNLKQWIEKSENRLKDSFSSLSKDITENNSKFFLDNANEKLNDFASKLKENLQGNNEKVDSMVKPVDTELKNLQEKMTSLTERVDNLKSQNSELKNATDMLNNTLKNNSLRGKWGEEQLRKIAELSGMIAHIDFEEQETNGKGSRPDMVIHLTGGRTIPVDSKVPMNAYIKYLNESDDQQRKKYLDEHVKSVRNHIDTLNKKAYWKDEKRAAELVAMVVPYESGLSAAFSTDQNIFSYAMEKNVLLLSPMTFYAFLKSVSIGWQENAMSKNAQEIANLSKELIGRFEKFFSYMENVGKSINDARDQYDKAMSSYNTRLSVTFNRFKQYSTASDMIEEKPTYMLTDNNSKDE
ncbi:MAG: DNA recombination protein RmuC [Erysipelotrichia bacterium]|nr:DNA recombination protein RmuC [Erysipelotrichia bacterium]